MDSCQDPAQNGEQLQICPEVSWRLQTHTDTLWNSPTLLTILSMSDTTPDAVGQETATGVEPGPATTQKEDIKESTSQPEVSFAERYSEILTKVNSTLDKVDWSQMGRIGKATGVILVVIVAQILIKGVLDTINLLPVVPGLLELLGLVVVGNWSWQNLTTSEKRGAVVSKLQNLRQEYLG